MPSPRRPPPSSPRVDGILSQTPRLQYSQLLQTPRLQRSMVELPKVPLSARQRPSALRHGQQQSPRQGERTVLRTSSVPWLPPASTPTSPPPPIRHPQSPRIEDIPKLHQSEVPPGIPKLQMSLPPSFSVFKRRGNEVMPPPSSAR